MAVVNAHGGDDSICEPCNGREIMTRTRSQYSVRGARRLTQLLLAPALAAVVLLQGCTDLEESPTSVITPENFFQTEQEVLGSLASVYGTLRNTQWGVYNLSSITTDEQIVPTRGSDWFDNGRWLEIHRQTCRRPARRHSMT